MEDSLNTCISEKSIGQQFSLDKVKEEMDKEILIKYAKELQQEALNANTYYLIMQQYRKNRHVYAEEMEISPLFYQTIYEALFMACFMEIGKLYDNSKNVVSIGFLLKQSEAKIELFPEYRERSSADQRGIPYQHQLKPGEECFFEQQIERHRQLLRALNLSNVKEQVQVDLTFPEFLKLYQLRLNAFSRKIENIRVQRNKLYAHNDVHRIMSDEALVERYSLSYQDIRELIELALDCTGLILGVLTGVVPATKYFNIDDWESTLKLVRLGLKYQEYELAEM